MEDINIKERLIDVIRKGNKEDSVWITPIALNDLEKYMEIRDSKYAPGKELKMCFYRSINILHSLYQLGPSKI